MGVLGVLGVVGVVGVLGVEVLPPELPDDGVEEAGFFFFFLGSDFSAGSALEPAMLAEIDADASSRGFVPAALALAVLPLLLEPPVALPAPNATAKATTTAATMIPI